MPGFSKPAICNKSGVVDFQYDPDNFHLTQEMKDVFDWDGVFALRGLLDKDELAKVEQVIASDTIKKYRWEQPDGKGRGSRMVIWSHPGTDVTGMVARSEKVAGTCEQLLGDEIYHYHSKFMLKEANTGGAHLWHQDYGYWYMNGALRPDMMMVFIAIDKMTKENGCLWYLKGTQRCGRIDHVRVAGQHQADPERVKQLSNHFELMHVDMEPGDALFFHCNILHKSEQNHSNQRRYALVCTYNRADNDPVYKHHHPNYTPMTKVPNSAIKECENVSDFAGKVFMEPADDTIGTTKGNKVEA